MIVELHLALLDKVGKILNTLRKAVSELENNESSHSGLHGNDVEIVIDGVGDGGTDDNELGTSFLGHHGSTHLYWEIAPHATIRANGLSWARAMSRILPPTEKCYWQFWTLSDVTHRCQSRRQ